VDDRADGACASISTASPPSGVLLMTTEFASTPSLVSTLVDDQLMSPLGSATSATSAGDTLTPLSLDRPVVPLELLEGTAGRHSQATVGDLLTHSSARFQVLVTLMADVVSLLVAVFLGLSVLAVLSSASANSLANIAVNLPDQLVLIFVTLVSFAVYGFYRQRRRRFRPSSFAGQVTLVHAVALGVLGTLGIGVVIHRLTGRPEISPAQLIAVAGAALVVVPVGRAIGRTLSHTSRRGRVRVLIVGSGLMAEQIRGHFADERGVELVGLVDDDPMPGTKVLGSIADAEWLCREHGVDRVLVGFSRTHPSDTVERLRSLHGKVPISVVPRYFELMSWRSQVEDIYGLPVIDVAPPHLGRTSRITKRTFDIAGSVGGLLLLAPLLAVIALVIRMSSSGPVLFGQSRIGRDGRPFTMYKFRTMRVGAHQERGTFAAQNEVDGPLFKIREDPRVFAFGRFLRRTSLDEIPQLLNVITGKMSLVGPRPFVPEEARLIDGWAARRFEVRPGLTGLWQVSGRNDLTYDQLVRLDYLYVASWSLWWDVKILCSTPAIALKGRGAY
jgi:exopolysaccharide biosynthesis polyprenyl glycosylphosphotransferase